MHDPDVVAFDIRRPWPRRSSGKSKTPRWHWQWHGAWWKPGSWSPFVTAAGREFYFPSLLVIWHHDPGGYDSFDKCPHGSRWRWHVHHWRIQVPSLQALRRWALTRCAWCGGRSRRGDPVNVSHSWDGPRGRWWQGEPGLYHGDCSAVRSAYQTCTCGSPLTEHDGYGKCLLCGRYRAYSQSEKWLINAGRLRHEIPERGRDRAAYARIVAKESA